MYNLELQAIRFKNFLNTGNEWESISFTEAKKTVIIGPNGSGKSTLLDALSFVFYKKPFRKISSLSQLVNGFNKKNCVVEVIFKSNGAVYMVRRGLKPNVFQIYKNNELIPEDSLAKSYQEMLEQDILRQNFKTFTQISIVGKAIYVPFMQLSTPDRRAFVENLLDAGIYGVMIQIFKDRVKNLKADLKDAERDFSVADAKLDTAQRMIDQMNAQQESSFSIYEDEIKKMENELQELQAKLSGMSNEGKQHAEKKKEIDAVIGPNRDALDDMFAEVRTMKREIEGHKNRIAKIDQLETCPTCLQAVDQDHKKHIEEDARSAIETLQSSVDDAEERIAILDTENEYLALKLADIDSFMDEAREIHTQIKRLESQIEDRKSALEAKREKASQEKPQISIEAIQEEADAAQERIDQIEKSIQKNMTCISHLGDDGIKAALVEKYIPIINETMNEYLRILDLFVEFELDNQFNETVKSMFREDFSYYSFSEGQKQRIDLAMMLTWRKIASKKNRASSNLLLLDEVLDGSLDPQGVDGFLSILNQDDQDQHIFVISHNNQTVDNFDSVIEVGLNGNFSTYKRISGNENRD